MPSVRKTSAGTEVLNIRGVKFETLVLSWTDDMGDGLLNYKGWYALDPALGCMELQWTYHGITSPASGSMIPITLTLGEPDLKFFADFDADFVKGHPSAISKYAEAMSKNNLSLLE
jgi:hypothetical protein